MGWLRVEVLMFLPPWEAKMKARLFICTVWQAITFGIPADLHLHSIRQILSLTNSKLNPSFLSFQIHFLFLSSADKSRCKRHSFHPLPFFMGSSAYLSFFWKCLYFVCKFEHIWGMKGCSEQFTCRSPAIN